MTRPSASRRLARSASVVALSATAALLLAGCSGAAAAPTATDSAAPSTAAVDVENCGVAQTFDSAPQRVVTIKSTSTEMLLALGLGDRIVGTAFQDGPVPEQWADDADGLHSISDFMPSEEALLQLEPDLVYSGWESAFSADQAGERDELESLGVASYVQPAACRSTGAPDRLDFDEIFREIEEVAAVFRVDADDLVDRQRAELGAIRPDDSGLTALWYSSGTDSPYVGAGTGAPQLVLDTVGLTNVAADVDQTWATLGWESIVADDPDVIVLIDADWNTAQSKIDQLRANPATAELSAVKNDRYLTLPFPAGEAGVRTVSAATSLAQQLAELEKTDPRLG